MQGIRKLLACCILSFLFFSALQAQDSTAWQGKAFGEARSFYLATWNKEELKDFQALALGGKLGYRQNLGKHFRLQAVGYLTANTQLQDLREPDLLTGKGSRYEIGLFSLADPDKMVIPLLGEAFAEYEGGRHIIRLGRQKVVSPFFNPQDGRMLPTLAEGLWYQYTSKSAGKWSGGLVHRVAPRSTHKFYGIGESIGLYPTGRQPNGQPSLFAGHTQSDFIALGNWQHAVGKKLSLNLWEYYVDNVFNTLYLNAELKPWEQGPELGLELVQQNRVGDGGNATDSLRYFTPERSHILGVQIKQGKPYRQLRLGYNRIFGAGRWLFPREWGRESLYTFQKRERSEGLADAHALLLTYVWRNAEGKGPVRLVSSFGRHWTPDVRQTEDNKYALPSYYQLNLDLFYDLPFLKGLQTELLFVVKQAGAADIPDNPALYLNKVDMLQIDWVLNYRF